MAIGAIGIVSFAAPNALALDCGVLPQPLCDKATDVKSGDTVENSAVWQLLRLVVRIMTAGAGIAAVGGIVYGAVMYTTAGSNQDQTKRAKTIFTNVVIGVVAFAAMFGLLQWLMPGGVFG